MTLRLPLRPEHLELGLGLDLPWGQEPGMLKDPIRGDVVSEPVVAFLERHATSFGHLSVAWQPRRRARVDPRDYFPAYDDLFARVGHRFATRALHQTALSRRAVEAYRRGELLELTNALIERYRFDWVSEDLGLWPIQRKPPNTSGPSLNQEGLWAAIRHARVTRAGLQAPLLVDFPTFATGSHEGSIHAYDFFRQVAEGADVGVMLDTAKLLSYQWQRGSRGADLLGELERLPLERCFQVHVSARDAKNGRSFQGPGADLFDVEFELLERLTGLCPNVRVVTHEGALFGADGEAATATLSEFAQLREGKPAWVARGGALRGVALPA